MFTVFKVKSNLWSEGQISTWNADEDQKSVKTDMARPDENEGEYLFSSPKFIYTSCIIIATERTIYLHL